MNANYKDGWIVALLAIMVPIIMMVMIVIPIYGCAIIGLYFVYGEVIFNYWSRYNMVINTYDALYTQWKTVPAYDIGNFFLPTFGPLIIGVILTLFLLGWFINYIRGVFSHS